MRIGLFTDTYIPNVDGVVTVLKLMKRELNRMGHEVFVFCPSHPRAPEGETDVFRFPSVEFVFYHGYRIAIPYSRSAFKIIPTLDIIHSQSPGPTGLLALYAQERYHIPHVNTYHDLYIDYRRYLPRLIRPTRGTIKRMSRILCNRCNAIIAPSDQMKRELESYGITRPIYAVPFGVDEEEFSGEVSWDVRSALNYPAEDLLLYAGRIGREKNLDFLVRAFGHLQMARPNARLIIAGNGPYRPDLEEFAASLKVNQYIKFTGFLERSNLIDLYKQANLFVFASKTDTQGIVLEEAMMAGTPAVAVNKMGPVDIIKNGETGFLVNENADEFAGACLKILEDHALRQKMGDAAREWARAHSAQASTQRLVEIYNECLNRKGTIPETPIESRLF